MKLSRSPTPRFQLRRRNCEVTIYGGTERALIGDLKMGLAMYAIMMPKRLRKETDIKWEGYPIFHDWPGHPDLYGWLEGLYFLKGGKFDQLAGSTVRLEVHNIDELERVLRFRKLPVFKRFPCISYPYMLDDDLNFIWKAREALSQGLNVAIRATY